MCAFPREAAARKASEKLRAEALRRADRLLKDAAARKQAEAEAAGGGGDFGLASDVGATAAGGVDQSSSGRGAANRRRVEVAGRQDNPQVYVEARHMQVRRAHAVWWAASGLRALDSCEGLPACLTISLCWSLSTGLLGCTRVLRAPADRAQGEGGGGGRPAGPGH